MKLRGLFLINVIYIFIGLRVTPLSAQSLFSIIPPISGGFNGHARLFNSAADSSGIFVLGEYPYYKIEDSSRYYIQNIMLRLDYNGNLIYIKNFPLIDSYDLTQYNYSLIKKNDSIVYLWALYHYSGERCNSNIIYELNINTGDILKERKLHQFTDDCQKSYLYQKGFYSKEKGKLFIPSYLRTGQQNDGDLHLIVLDTNLQIIRLDTFSYPENHLIIASLLPNSIGGYDGIGNINKKINEYYQKFPVFIRIDSNYKIFKTVVRKDFESFFYQYANFSPTKDPDGNWVTLISKDTLNRAIDSTDSNYIPYIMKFSPEGDTLIWSARFQNPDFRFDNIYSHFTMGRCKDNSGYIGMEDAFGTNKDSTSYIRMFKVSEMGDSLWTRYFYILGKEERTSFCDLFPMTETPYQTFVVQGSAKIKKTGIYKPWLMHFDYHGCIVPGCQIQVSSEDLKSGKVRPIDIYPNPIHGRNIQFLSHINSAEKVRVILYDLNGFEVYKHSIVLKEQAQYQILLPEELYDGIYIFKIIGNKIDHTSKVEITRN
ncbi:MAG: T9SS type A sorting domain-containing protein [Saprospiraceae bacterium]|jgi:hypothetical protein